MAATRTVPAGLLNTAQAAAYLGREPQTLRKWRSLGEGPRFSGRGRGVRYRLRDLDAWIDANTHTSTR
jgi:hypothetical protein